MSQGRLGLTQFAHSDLDLLPAFDNLLKAGALLGCQFGFVG